jgi:hypothetical protein
MIGYLIAIAGSPNPPWPVLSSDSDSGSYTVDGQTVYASTYIAYNVLWEGCWNVRTYHWARVWNLPNKKEKFTWEFRHRPDTGDGFITGDGPEESDLGSDGDKYDKDDSDGAWEHDESYHSYHSNPPEGQTWSWNSYTEIRKGVSVAYSEVTITLGHVP